MYIFGSIAAFLMVGAISPQSSPTYFQENPSMFVLFPYWPLYFLKIYYIKEEEGDEKEDGGGLWMKIMYRIYVCRAIDYDIIEWIIHLWKWLRHDTTLFLVKKE